MKISPSVEAFSAKYPWFGVNRDLTEFALGAACGLRHVSPSLGEDQLYAQLEIILIRYRPQVKEAA